MAKEGEMIENIIDMEKQMDKIGYNEEDFIVEKHEYPNCIWEYVAPKDYVRPEFKPPKEKAKNYPFKLDKF